MPLDSDTVSCLTMRDTTRFRHSLTSNIPLVQSRSSSPSEYHETIIQSHVSPSEIQRNSGTVSCLTINLPPVQFQSTPSEAPLDSGTVSWLTISVPLVQFQSSPSEAPLDSGTVSCLTINVQWYSPVPHHQRYH